MGAEAGKECLQEASLNIPVEGFLLLGQLTEISHESFHRRLEVTLLYLVLLFVFFKFVRFVLYVRCP